MNILTVVYKVVKINFVVRGIKHVDASASDEDGGISTTNTAVVRYVVVLDGVVARRIRMDAILIV